MAFHEERRRFARLCPGNPSIFEKMDARIKSAHNDRSVSIRVKQAIAVIPGRTTRIGAGRAFTRVFDTR